METEGISIYVKLWSGLALINIFLAALANFAVLGVWYSIFTDTSDNMFLGLLMIPLFFITIWYVILLLRTIRVFRARFKLKNKLGISCLILLFFNTGPFLLPYVFRWIL